MPTVNLDSEEWQRVIQIIAQAPWNVANPLLMKIGEQLREHPVAPTPVKGNSKGKGQIQEAPDPPAMPT